MASGKRTLRAWQAGAQKCGAARAFTKSWGNEVNHETLEKAWVVLIRTTRPNQYSLKGWQWYRLRCW